jgi:DNA-binding beta-propeller fold protein YncE
MNSSRALVATLATALSAALLATFATAAGARTLYVANYASGTVSALSIAADGSLAPVAGSPFAAVAATAGLAVAPDGATLLAQRTQNPGALTAFTPAGSGALTLKSGVAPAAGNFPSYSTVEPTGRFAYVSNTSGLITDRDISGFALAGTSMPTSLGPPFDGAGINMAGIAASVDGRFVYAGTNAGTSNLLGYSVGAGGQLTPLPGSPFNVGANSAASVVVSPDGRFVFIGDVGADAIVTAAIAADGTPTPVGTPVALGVGAQAPANLALTPDGRRLYSANDEAPGRSISSFAVGADGTLSPIGSPLLLATAPRGIAVTPDGRRLYAALSGGGANVLGYSIGADGGLSSLPGSPYPSGGDNINTGADQALAIAPDQGPGASFTAKAKSSTSRRVTFDGAGSTDPDGKVAVYEWEFGDGKAATSTTPKVEHVYAKDGKYQAKLRVVDDEGCSATLIYTGQATLCNGGAAAVATVAVTVNTPPVVTIQSVRKRLAKGKLAGLTVRFRMSEAGTARVAIERKTAGRKVGQRCVKPKRSKRSKTRCARYVTVLSRSVKVKRAGRGVVAKIGKRAVKRLEPGSYRVAVKGRDTTGKWSAKPAYKKFKVAQPK